MLDITRVLCYLDGRDIEIDSYNDNTIYIADQEVALHQMGRLIEWFSGNIDIKVEVVIGLQYMYRISLHEYVSSERRNFC